MVPSTALNEQVVNQEGRWKGHRRFGLGLAGAERRMCDALAGGLLDKATQVYYEYNAVLGPELGERMIGGGPREFGGRSEVAFGGLGLYTAGAGKVR